MVCFARIDAIEELEPTDEYVYDASVQDSHMFFANGILVHNTDSIFLSFDEALKHILGNDYDTADDDTKTQLVLKLVKLCAKYINDYLIKDVLAKHNTPSNESIANKFDFVFKEELIIKKSLFRDKKKKYAINIILNEGKKVDKIVITGIEVVRSDFPRFSKDILDQLIKKVLKENMSVSNVIDLIYSYKSNYIELLNAGSLETGIPCGWGIRTYTSIPRGIKGMQIYNAIYGKKFKPGDKGYYFNLSNAALGRLGFSKQKISEIMDNLKMNELIKKTIDVITVPEDSTLDTKIFTPDVDNMLERAIFNRVEFITDIYNLAISNIDAVQW